VIRIARRQALKSLGAAAASFWASPSHAAKAAPACNLPVECLLEDAEEGPVRTASVRYRVDAAILLWFIPIYTRKGGGGAYGSLEERTADSRRFLSLNFSAGSYPERANGVNRLGYFEEVIELRDREPQQAAYFGFMTRSKEDNVDEAREALGDSEKETALYEAVDGHIAGGWEDSRGLKRSLPARYTWKNIGKLSEFVRGWFTQADDESAFNDKKAEAKPHLFLHTVMEAAWSREKETVRRYYWRAKRYRLETERKPDQEMGAKLAEKGLTKRPDQIVELKGKIINETLDEDSSFKLWIEDTDGRPLPLRFEYKARSFLRMTFERDPEQKHGVLTSRHASRDRRQAAARGVVHVAQRVDAAGRYRMRC